MKARIKATDEIIEVDAVRRFSNERGNYIVYIDVRTFKEYNEKEVDTKDLTTLAEVRHMHTVDPDYWTRLEHQAAIAAMGGICGNTSYDEITWEDMAKDAIKAAHALVEKMKEEKR